MRTERQDKEHPERVKVVHHRGRRRLRRALVGLGILVIAIGLVAGSVVLYLRHLCYRLTEPEALSLPVTTLSQGEARKVQKSYERFLLACRRQQPERIEFTSRELNGIIGVLDECQALRGRIAIDIVNGQPWVKASIPLDEIGLHWVKGRYLNGEFKLGVFTTSKGLEISILEAIVKGGSVPVWILRRIQSVDLLKNAYNDPKWGPRIRQVDGLEFSLDKVVVKTKKGRR